MEIEINVSVNNVQMQSRGNVSKHGPKTKSKTYCKVRNPENNKGIKFEGKKNTITVAEIKT